MDRRSHGACAASRQRGLHGPFKTWADLRAHGTGLHVLLCPVGYCLDGVGWPVTRVYVLLLFGSSIGVSLSFRPHLLPQGTSLHLYMVARWVWVQNYSILGVPTNRITVERIQPGRNIQQGEAFLSPHESMK